MNTFARFVKVLGWIVGTMLVLAIIGSPFLKAATLSAFRSFCFSW